PGARGAKNPGSEEPAKAGLRREKSMPTLFRVNGVRTDETGAWVDGHVLKGQIAPGDELEVLGKAQGSVRVTTVEVSTDKTVYDAEEGHRIAVSERRPARARERATLALVGKNNVLLGAEAVFALATPGSVPRARMVRVRLLWASHRDGRWAGPQDPEMVKAIPQDTHASMRIGDVRYSATLLTPTGGSERPPPTPTAPPIPPTPIYEIPEWTLRVGEPFPAAVGMEFWLDLDNVQGAARGEIIGVIE
ncbi:MAG TPA: hypothetical protein VMK12_14200, partial [Anaeromyxobacteraceae bacterium]|nr:hypothetical protein [Anaeromyxobacteraceae bacterium]